MKENHFSQEKMGIVGITTSGPARVIEVGIGMLMVGTGELAPLGAVITLYGIFGPSVFELFKRK